MFYGVLNTLSGELEFSVGGHAMPYRFSSDGAQLISGEGGPVLGILEDAVYPSARIRLDAGDGLLLYTDGVTEAFDVSGNEYSSERLQVLVDQLRALPVRTLVTEIFQSIREFSSNAPQSDDITVLALRYPGPSSTFLPSLDLLTKSSPIQPVTLA
jgi:phosphoserine phosphatase RsbU/P